MDNPSRFTTPFALAAAMLTVPAVAQETADGVAAASVVDPLQITKTADLDFGTLIPNGTGRGRVVINARTGARRTNANITTIDTDGFQRATFQITGEPRAMVNLTTSSAAITLTGPGAPMPMDRIRVNRNNGGQRELPQAYRIARSGTIDIGFGGRLRVASDQAPGRYTGTFDLIATYQ